MSPWTRKQVKMLLSSGSPLTPEQKEKMKAELHANPAMGHRKKGSKAMKRGETVSGKTGVMSNPFDAKTAACPVCEAPAGQQCPQGPNHVERGRLARWIKMGLVEADAA